MRGLHEVIVDRIFGVTTRSATSDYGKAAQPALYGAMYVSAAQAHHDRGCMDKSRPRLANHTLADTRIVVMHLHGLSTINPELNASVRRDGLQTAGEHVKYV